MADKIRQQAPWWLSLALAAMGAFQQWTLQGHGERESTNGEAIHALIGALMECQKSQP